MMKMNTFKLLLVFMLSLFFFTQMYAQQQPSLEQQQDKLRSNYQNVIDQAQAKQQQDSLTLKTNFQKQVDAAVGTPFDPTQINQQQPAKPVETCDCYAKNQYNTPDNFYYDSTGKKRIRRVNPPCDCLANGNSNTIQSTTPIAVMPSKNTETQSPKFDIDYN